MSNASTIPADAQAPTFDRLAVLELLAEFVFLTSIFGILTARVVDDAGPNRYTAHGLTVGFMIGAGIALALVLGTVWAWRRTGGRPAQRSATRACSSGALPHSPAERALLLGALEQRKRITSRAGLSPTVLAVIWVVIAGLQVVAARDALTPIAWVLMAFGYVGYAIHTRRRRQQLPQLHALIARLHDEEP